MPTELRIGETWELVPGGEHASVISGGEHDGRRIDRVLTSPPPVMIKLLDASSDLSLQVHSRKWEAWLILAASPGARLYSGLREGAGSEDLAAALDTRDSDAIRSCLRALDPAPGMFLVNPPGTIHAIGGGLLLLEVQTPHDETLRLWDWERQPGDDRPLQRSQALTALDEDSRPMPDTNRRVRGPGFEIGLPDRGGGRVTVSGAGFEIGIELGTPPGSSFDLWLVSQSQVLRSE